MAKISAATNEKIFPIKSWLGLNEAPDGDTKLKMGEASVMQNWHVTRDGNLKRRPGTKTVAGLRNGYEVGTSEVGEVLFTEPETFAIECFSSYITGDLKNGELFGSLGELTAADVLERTGQSTYIEYQDKPYLIGSVTAVEGGYAWSGFRAYVAPTQSDVRRVTGLWSGRVAGRRTVLAACGGYLYSLWDDENGIWQRTQLSPALVSEGGTASLDTDVHIFPFDGKAYILTGQRYMVYDGTTLSDVAGYIPLVAIAISPLVNGELGTAVSGDLLEAVNLLNGKRRAWLSPDGVGNTFQLPEAGMTSIDYVKDLKENAVLPTTDYEVDTQAGTVSFGSVPLAAANAYEVGWTVPAALRGQVEHMRYSELYAGSQDTRVFLYGDGSNMAIYSGLDYNGTPTAEYFPDQSAIRIGDGNSPITQMIRHNSSLIAYKTDSTFSITFGITSLATDVYTPAFYSTPINRSIGNLSVGQVQIVGNNPVTSFGEHLYMWKGNQYGNLTTDEKNVKLISAPVQASIKELRLSLAKMWDDNDGQELFITDNGKTLVWNYEANAWARYSGLNIVCMTSFNNMLLFGTADGRLCVFDEDAYSDDGEPIDARWDSGAMSFGADYMRKLSAKLWVGMKPVSGSSVTVTVETDRKDTFAEKLVSSDKAKIAGEPFMARCKLKAKKFVYYRLMLLSNEYAPPATVTAVDIQVRSAGYTK